MVTAVAFLTAGAPRPVGTAGWHDPGFEHVGPGAIAETGRVGSGWEVQETGEWGTYRFIHIPAHSGPWKVYVQLNGWGNLGFPVTISVDDLVCNPKPGAP